MYVELWWVLLAVGLVLLLLAAYGSWTAGRLDRLHARVDAARRCGDDRDVVCVPPDAALAGAARRLVLAVRSSSVVLPDEQAPSVAGLPADLPSSAPKSGTK